MRNFLGRLKKKFELSEELANLKIDQLKLQAGKQSKIKQSKEMNRASEIWGTIKHTNPHSHSKKLRQGERKKRISEELIGEKLSKVMKICQHIPGTQDIPSRINSLNSPLRHIIVNPSEENAS